MSGVDEHECPTIKMVSLSVASFIRIHCAHFQVKIGSWSPNGIEVPNLALSSSIVRQNQTIIVTTVRGKFELLN